jgi:hypothetical protein
MVRLLCAREGANVAGAADQPGSHLKSISIGAIGMYR